MGFACVTADEFASEVVRHCDCQQLKDLINDLHEAHVDLKAFCYVVRKAYGAALLLKTAKSLTTKKESELMAAASTLTTIKSTDASGIVSANVTVSANPPLLVHAVMHPTPSEPAEHSSRKRGMAHIQEIDTDDDASLFGSPRLKPARVEDVPCKRLRPALAEASARLEQASKDNVWREASKVLVHALLCTNDQCVRDGCSPLKRVLMALKDHAVSCTINPHGGGECETCNKWYRHEKLREHYRRKLIRAEKKQACVHAIRSCGELFAGTRRSSRRSSSQARVVRLAGPWYLDGMKRETEITSRPDSLDDIELSAAFLGVVPPAVVGPSSYLHWGSG